LRDIGPREIRAGEEKRHAGDRCNRIRHAVPEIQGRSTRNSWTPLHHLGFQPAQKREDHRTGILSDSRRQYHCGFEQSGDSHGHHFCIVDAIDQPFVTGSRK
jgi:hypothetical protein